MKALSASSAAREPPRADQERLTAAQATPTFRVEMVQSGGREEAAVVTETRPGPKGLATRRVIARYRLLSGAAAQLRSRLAQMEARLSALEQEMQKVCVPDGLPSEITSLQGVRDNLRGQQSQVLAELSRLQALLTELS